MIKIMFDNTKYSNKPDINEVKKLQNRLQQTEMKIKDLANNLAQGCTFKPAYLNGRTSNDFISQQLFALDFDNNSDIETELNRCKELNIIPVFSYTTFSHKENHHKFRLVFCNDEIITDIDERNKLQKSLVLAFPNCDQQVTDAGRLFFGGKQLIYKNYNSTIKGSDIVTRYNKVNNAIKTNNKRKTLPKVSENFYNEYIEAIKTLNVDSMKNLLFYQGFQEKVSRYTYYIDLSTYPKPTTLESSTDLYDFIDSINLYEFLGLEEVKTFNCIIHDDTNPSATILINDEDKYIYHCFGCGFSGGLIQIIELLSKRTRYHAIKFIKEVFNVDLYTERQKEYRSIIDENIEYIQNGRLAKDYPDLWGYIKPRKNDLIALLTYAKSHVVDDENYQVNDVPIFYVSLSYLLNIFSCKSSATANNTIQLFCILDLCSKINPKDLPVKLNIKHNSFLKYDDNDKQITKQINTYQIPSYSINVLWNSNQNAIELKEHNFTMKGLSREYLLRTFDEEFANKIYPQDSGKKINNKAKHKSNIIYNIIEKHLENNKYITENKIIEQYQTIELISADKVKIQIKRSIQEILDTFGLIRVRANKQLKEYFGISSNGYPFLILKNEDYIKFVEGCEK